VNKIHVHNTLWADCQLQCNYCSEYNCNCNCIRCLCLAADGILLSRSDDVASVQLADFTCAVSKSQIDSDDDIGEMLRMALPAEVIPPEVSSLILAHMHVTNRISSVIWSKYQLERGIAILMLSVRPFVRSSVRLYNVEVSCQSCMIT